MSSGRVRVELSPWNPVRIAAAPEAFRCVHCGATGGTAVEYTVQGFMRKLRAFEREHNRCAPAARVAQAGDASAVIRMAQGGAYAPKSNQTPRSEESP